MEVEATTPKNEVSKAVNTLLMDAVTFKSKILEHIDDINDIDMDRIKITLEVEFEQIFIQIAATREIIYSKSQMTDRPFIL